MEKFSGIYKIENLVNGKVYIGSAVNCAKRKTDHFSTLQRNKHSNYHLQKSFNKYGAKNFKFVFLKSTSKENLIIHEQLFMDRYQSYNCKLGYNICQQAGNTIGYKHSTKSRRKMSKIALGRPSQPKGKESLCAKTYELLDPSGTVIMITGLLDFCRNNKLDPGALRRVWKGKSSQHKGWRKAHEAKIGITCAPVNIRRPRTFINPKGEKITLSGIYAFKKFGLHATALRRLEKNQQKQHKGWTFKPKN